jgi:excisionase family DNA binding protein
MMIRKSNELGANAAEVVSIAQHINTSEVATVKEVADYLRLTPKTVRRMIEAGKLKAIECGSGSRKLWRIPLAEVRRVAACGKDTSAAH